MGELITTNQAARILNVTPVRVRQFIAEKRLNSEKHGRDHLLDREAVLKFKESVRKGGRPAKD